MVANIDVAFVGARKLSELSDPATARHHPMVLVVDDDKDAVTALAEGLRGQPYTVQACLEPAEALLIVGRLRPDLVVLAPVGGLISSLEFLELVRQGDPDLPILVAAAPSDGDFVARASTAANIVVPKPYRTQELAVIVQSYLNSVAIHEARRSTIDLGRLRIDGAAPQMWLDGDCVRLPPREYLLLRYLAERPGMVVPRTELVHAVWGSNATNSNTLTVHIARLRKRFGDDEHDPEWLRAIRGLGYQFQVPERHAAPPARRAVPAQREPQ